jgi:UDP-N-acetylglucosamine 2-epimerase (non-hydrolysing)
MSQSSLRKVLIVVGTRPNFIKVTQFKKEFERYKDLDVTIVHTGQHYDAKMADVFFDQFRLRPDHFLNIGKGTANQQMAEIMVSLEKVLQEISPRLIIVVGDVNSTLAAAITANKMNITIAHLESGLRSGDMTMPEEINRILTDKITDYYFITEQSGLDHLSEEGQDPGAMHFVGNTMIDTMVAFEKEIEAADILEKLALKAKEFVLMTMHRPATVDHKDQLEKLLSLMEMVTSAHDLVFPIHPRTIKSIESFGLKERLEKIQRLRITEPMGYFSFQKLVKHAAFILTDSGGIQEESTFRKVPCLTLRPNTERPSTVTMGTNELVTFELDILKSKIEEIRSGSYKKGQVPPLWDGRSTERIVSLLDKLL